MKKVFLFALAAIVVASGFTSCKQEKKDDPGTSIKLILSEHELLMKKDDAQRLRVTFEPASASPKVTWKSTNEAVATVTSTGNVTAIANGEAQIIVSAEGATGDTCYVTVADLAAYDIFEISDYGLFGEFVEVPNTDTVIEISIGEVNVKLYTIDMYIWDSNLSFVNGSGFSGDGLMTIGEVAAYCIVAGAATTAANADAYIGNYIGSGFWGFADIAAAGYSCYPYYGQSGKIDVENYGKFMTSMFNAESAEDLDMDAYQKMIKGAYVYEVDADNDAWYSYYPLAVINQMVIEEDDADGFEYGAIVTWSNYTDDDRFYGLKVTTKEVEGVTYLDQVVTPYDYATVGPMHFGAISFNQSEENEAPKYHIINPKRIHKEVPAFVKAIKKDRLYRK
jgi:hypothetical protein